MRLCFATNNENKLLEIRNLLGGDFEIISLQELGHLEELEESFDTLEDNSNQKAEFIHTMYDVNCFADDTGLEVDALGGAPGVISARYAGPGRSSEDNMKLLLKNLSKAKNRNARFRTVITLYIDNDRKQFEGIAEGEILESPRGTMGFGYDPVFQPDGYDHSFAEMSLEEKNRISHRGKALALLTSYLTEHKL